MVVEIAREIRFAWHLPGLQNWTLLVVFFLQQKQMLRAAQSVTDESFFARHELRERRGEDREDLRAA